MHGPWNASSERKLLLCIIGLQSKLKWNVIAQRMGGGFTDEACRYVDFFSCNAQSTRVRLNINWWTPHSILAPVVSRFLQRACWQLLAIFHCHCCNISKLDILLDTSYSIDCPTASLLPSNPRSNKMPFNWTVERERQMLLLAICEANLKPTMETWSIVAKILGEDITPSAVRWDASCRLSLHFPILLAFPIDNAYPCPSPYTSWPANICRCLGLCNC